MSLKDNDGVIVLGSDTLNPLNNITLKSTTSGSLEVFQGVPGNLGNLVTTLDVNGSATESLAGIVKIASAAQAQGLTDNSTVLSPARLASAFKNGNQSLSVIGYQKLPGGLIIQWGTSAASQSATTWPIAFPNACLSCAVISNSSATTTTYGTLTTTGTTFSLQSSTSGANQAGATCKYIVIGH